MATSFKRTYTRTVVGSAPDPTTELCRHTPPPETPLHTQASKAQPLVGSLLLSPGSWCTQGFFFVLSKGVCFPVLWNCCSQILLTFKVGFPGDTQSLCQIPRLESLLWGLELSQQCGNLFGIIVLQFASCLPWRLCSGANGNILQEDLCASQDSYCRASGSMAGHC